MVYFPFKHAETWLPFYLVAQDEQEHVTGRAIEIHPTSTTQAFPVIEYD